jgi:hypothetical protein
LKIIFFFQDQLGSADVSQNEYDQILMGDNSSNVVGIENFRTIDRKKEEQRARNREYQRQYREKKRNEAAQITGSEANIRAANREYQRRYREKKRNKAAQITDSEANIKAANLLNTNEKMRAPMDSSKVSQNMISLNPNSFL